MASPDSLNQLRVFHLASQEFMPMVDELHTTAYTKLINEFRAGNPNLVAFVARCEAIQSLIEDIQAKSIQFQNQTNKTKEKP